MYPKHTTQDAPTQNVPNNDCHQDVRLHTRQLRATTPAANQSIVFQREILLLGIQCMLVRLRIDFVKYEAYKSTK